MGYKKYEPEFDAIETLRPDFITLPDGTLYAFNVNTGETTESQKANLRIRGKKETSAKRFPQEVTDPLLPSYKKWKIQDKLYQLVSDLVKGTKEINAIRDEVKEDSELSEYIKKQSPFQTIYDKAQLDNINDFGPKVTLPPNTFINYLQEQVRSQCNTLSQLRSIEKRLFEKVEQRFGNKNLEENVAAILYDDKLRNEIFGENFLQLKYTDKKERAEELSTIVKLEESKLQKKVTELRKNYTTNEKKLLNYSDFTKYRTKETDKIFAQIEEFALETLGRSENEYSYANIARKFGLTSGKVVKQLVGKRYKETKAKIIDFNKYRAIA